MKLGLLSNFYKLLGKRTEFAYSDYASRSSPYRGSEWDDDIFRATVDAIATHAAKGTAKHVILDKNGHIAKTVEDSAYARLLNLKPNPIMSGFEFKYRMVAQLETQGTALAYVRWNGSRPEMIVPVDYNRFEILEVIGGGYAVRFQDYSGRTILLPMEDCIVIRKFYNECLAAGDGNGPIYKVFDMESASDDGFMAALNVSNKVRGLLKQKKTMLDPKDVQKSQDEFAERFKRAAENGGVVGIDSTEEYTPINASVYAANSSQMKEIANRIYSFLRTPEAIVQSSYSEQIGLAWHESKIEPIWTQLSEALTTACFTQREIGVGNRILITGGVQMGTSYQTRVNIISQTKDVGVLTINEQRELLGFPPIEEGDVREVSLNYVKADEQSQYQGAENE